MNHNPDHVALGGVTLQLWTEPLDDSRDLVEWIVHPDGPLRLISHDIAPNTAVFYNDKTRWIRGRGLHTPKKRAVLQRGIELFDDPSNFTFGLTLLAYGERDPFHDDGAHGVITVSRGQRFGERGLYHITAGLPDAVDTIAFVTAIAQHTTGFISGASWRLRHLQPHPAWEFGGTLLPARDSMIEPLWFNLVSPRAHQRFTTILEMVELAHVNISVHAGDHLLGGIWQLCPTPDGPDPDLATRWRELLAVYHPPPDDAPTGGHA